METEEELLGYAETADLEVLRRLALDGRMADEGVALDGLRKRVDRSVMNQQEIDILFFNDHQARMAAIQSAV